MTTTLPDIDHNGRFSPTQAAAVLEVSRPTIYAAMRTGELPYKLTSKSQRRILGSSLLRYYHTH